MIDEWAMLATMAISVIGLVLNHLRERRLDEWAVQRLHDGVTGNTREIHEQARRVDALFSDGAALAQRVEAIEQPPDEKK